MDYEISFADSDKSPLELPSGSVLSEKLNADNSPILFGCRMGICGTCTVEVVKGGESLHKRTDEEVEFLDELVPEKINYRLACQIHLNANICVRKVRI